VSISQKIEKELNEFITKHKLYCANSVASVSMPKTFDIPIEDLTILLNECRKAPHQPVMSEQTLIQKFVTAYHNRERLDMEYNAAITEVSTLSQALGNQLYDPDGDSFQYFKTGNTLLILAKTGDDYTFSLKAITDLA
jgi:hypothetical protein